MAMGDPRNVQKTHVFTLRPFKGRNSDMDAMSIENNQASGGSNFRTLRGVLRRRPSFARIGQNMSLPGGLSNRIHAFVELGSGSDTVLRAVGTCGMFNIMDGDTATREEGGTAIMNPSYSSGTVATTAGSTTVTGTGVAWISRGAHPGGTFSMAQGTYAIKSVNSETSITLTTAAAASGSGLNYRIHPYGSAPTEGSGRDKFTVPAARAMGLSYATFGGTSFCQGTINSTVSSGTMTVTYGQFAMSLSAAPAASGIQWIRLHDDTADENASGPRTTHGRRRQYRAMRVNGATITLHERYRGATGTMTSPYTNGVVFNNGYPALLDSSAHCLARIERAQSGTVSFAQGSTTVSGTGTSFAVGTVLPGDEIFGQTTSPFNAYRIGTVGSNTSITLSQPTDGGVGSGQSCNVMSYRRISSSSSPTVRPQRATLPAGTFFGTTVDPTSGLTHFYPLFWGSGTTPNKRIQATAISFDNPYPDLSMSSSQPNPPRLDSILVCTGDIATTSTTGYNIWWSTNDDTPRQVGLGYFTSITLGWLMPLSLVAPKARFTEFWNGRVFGADLAVYLGSSSITGPATDYYQLSPLGLQWTRPDEPMTWWNQYATDGAGDDTIRQGTGSLMAMKVHLSATALAVYREQGITLFHPTGDSINPFSTSFVESNVAPVCTEAILEVEDGHLFLATDGSVRIFNGAITRELPCPLVRYIQDNMRWTDAHWTVAVHEKVLGEYIWFIPTGSNTDLTEAVAYNYRDQQWYLYDFTSRPLTAVAYVERNESTFERRMIGADTNLNIVAFNVDEAYDFTASLSGGTAISPQWISKEFTLPLPDLESEGRVKEVKQVEIQYDPAYSGIVTVDVSGDGGASWTSFGNASFRSGTTGTATTLTGGTSGYGVRAETHMVRLTQTPTNTSDPFDMGVKGLRLYYTDMGATHR